MSGNLVKMTPEQRRERKMQGRKRAAQVGLANNAFGAAAGAAGTKLAWDVAREEVRAHNAKVKGIAYTPKVRQTVTQRGLGKLKLKPKHAVIAAGTVAVGSQLLNGAMDAQSATYFGQELKNMRSKQVGKADLSLTDAFVSKSDRDTGVGHSLVAKGLPSALRRIDRTNLIPSSASLKAQDYIGPRVAAHRRGQEAAKRTYRFRTADGQTAAGITATGSRLLQAGRFDRATARSRVSVGKSEVDVSKKIRRFDPEGDRQRRLGVYEGAGAAGAAAGMGAGGALAYRRGRKTGELLKLTPAQLKKLKTGAKVQTVPGALLAGGAGMAALGVAAHRRANSARNERWN